MKGRSSGEILKWLVNPRKNSAEEQQLLDITQDSPKKSATNLIFNGSQQYQKHPSSILEQLDINKVPIRHQSWAIIHQDGNVQYINTDKKIIQRDFDLKVNTRDLRLLDFELQSIDKKSFLVRENAIIFAIDNVRLLIMADKVIMQNDQDKRQESNSSFMIDKILKMLNKQVPPKDIKDNQCKYKPQLTNISKKEDSKRNNASLRTHNEEPEKKSFQMQTDFAEPYHQSLNMQSQDTDSLDVSSPFELRILELVLGEVVENLQIQVDKVHSFLDNNLKNIMHQVNTKALKQMKKAKTQHQKISSKVEALRDLIQRILDDDNDMQMLCLSISQFISQNQGVQNFLWVPNKPSMANSLMHRMGSFQKDHVEGDKLSEHSRSGGLSQEEVAVMRLSGYLQVETLLESFFVDIDSSCQKLQNLEEEVEDTEEYIQLNFNSQRNSLLRIEISMTTATLSLAIIGLVSGIFGENLHIPEVLQSDVKYFLGINFCVSIFAIVVFFLCIFFVYKRTQ